jgi:uncharacterized 2Fe-2S/4Fe-4S cluster protein (DUF4445 family)
MKLKILPDNIELQVPAGTNLLAALTGAGVPLDASCGGNGVCGQCRIKLESGELAAGPGAALSAAEYDQGYRLACQCAVGENVTISIPAESRMDREVIYERRPTPSGQYLTEAQLMALNPGWAAEPSLRKIYLELPPPTAEDNVSDLYRVARTLRRDHGIEQLRVDLEALRSLPLALREQDWKATATLIRTNASDVLLPEETRPQDSALLIRIEPGDTRDRHFALALDIGTTTVSGQVVDLAAGGVRCTMNEYNDQLPHGADVISRILSALKPGGMDLMQARAADTINRVIGRLVAECGGKPEELSHLAAAGNTTMTHLLLKLYPKFLRESPYVPVANRAGAVMARELGLNCGPWARLYTFPCVASYVGGDIVAGVLATGIYKRPALALFIDIGTNGEMVIGNRDFLLCASASAGPAFEGGGISCGMHAAPGAIERYLIDPVTRQARFDTIRHKPARGICGSGIMNAVAGLLQAGLIERNGKINAAAKCTLVRPGPHGPELVLAPPDQTESGAEITLTESDLDNLLRAKAAMYAGYMTLVEHVGMSLDQIHDVFIAGNFGNTLDIENAITLGLLPDIDRDKFKFVGNSSLRGARLVCQSAELLHDAETIARNMTNVEFWDNPRFMEHYTASMFFPHTDDSVFPTVMERLKLFRERRQARGGP